MPANDARTNDDDIQIRACLDVANERLRAAAEQLKEAQENLHAAEVEHREACEQVDYWESKL